MKVNIEPSWNEVLKEEWEKPYFENLVNFVKQSYAKGSVYPPGSKIFAAFDAVPFDDVKVVILGQDPYHGYGQANGLSFSVNDGVPLPPSLRNIYKEIADDLNITPCTTGDLSRWARQGVLLLNSTLTVNKDQAGSHQGKGWEEFTDRVIGHLSSERENLVFILWGNYAIMKGSSIDKEKHLVITSPHPSPFSASRGFFGSKPFSRANNYLIEHGQTPIDWH